MFWFQTNTSSKTQLVGQERGCNKVIFFMSLCFAICEKLSFFLAIFEQILVDVQKHYKIGISAHFKSKKKPRKKRPFLMVINWCK